MILSWGYVQDERYIAMEHMDVRRDSVRFAQQLKLIMDVAPERHTMRLSMSR
ncbi:MAG: hypothetical protein QNK19_04745 [Xanthomonadales bacterium]|nr:hypothetical protein [Xanthomonadales bacterium]